MTFPAHIFKAYDIRGVYGEDLSDDLAYKVGCAYAELVKSENNSGKQLTVVVGEDMRTSSPVLKKAVIEGITDQGVNVMDIGLASTPTFYFGVSYFNYDGGLQVSASHNPAKYNGFKMVRAHAVPISGDTGIMAIRDAAEKGVFTKAPQKGIVSNRTDVLDTQIEYALKQVNINEIKPFKVVIDTANGMGAPLAEALFRYLPCQVTKLYFELDGSFPNHEADPFKDENNKVLQDTVRSSGADIGIALDGDADRLFFIDNTGKTVTPAIVRGILAQIFLREKPGSPVCYDIRPGKITRDMIEEVGGKPFVTKVGHSLIKEKARELDAIFAGESSGHFFLNRPHGFFEMPEIMILNFLHEISVSGKTVAEYTAPLERYVSSGEINFKVADKESALNRLRAEFKDANINDLDGVTFTYQNVWFNIRPSNTESLLRLNVEGVNEKVVSEKVAEITTLITG